MRQSFCTLDRHPRSAPSNHSRSHRKRRRGHYALEKLDQRYLMAVTFQFDIVDPGNQFAAFVPDVQRTLDAAGSRWSQFLIGDVTIEYQVSFFISPNPGVLAQSGPADLIPIRTDANGVDILQGSTANEIVTGIDPNGTDPDAFMEINITNLGDFFFDPDVAPTFNGVVPPAQFDAYSIFLHEMCHALGFLGIRDDFSGAIPPDGQTTYDQWIDFDPVTQNFTFIGPEAVAINGGLPVALSFGSISHVGNFGGNGQALTDDLMSTSIGPGERREISALDRAMLDDAETPIQVNVSNPPVNGLLHITGTSGNDTITLTLSHRTYLVRINGALQEEDMVSVDEITSIIIDGMGGDDVIILNNEAPACVINGDDGNDTIIGGAKSDTINGGPGRDSILGNSGNDYLRGGTGDDQVFGGGGMNRIFGNSGDDYMVGGVGVDNMIGNDGADTLCGTGGNDFLIGNEGNDLLVGGTGKDRMNGGKGADTFAGGTGSDMADYSLETDPVFVSVDNRGDDGLAGEKDNVMSGTENVFGSSAADRISGDGFDNYIIGGAGADTLYGGDGNDTVEGSGGNDRLDGGAHEDIVNGGAGNDRIFGGRGKDSLVGGSGNDIFYAVDGYVDSITGGAGIDTANNDLTDVIDDITTEIIVNS